MKYFKRLKVWKNSTGTNEFNPETMAAHSYGWWMYVKQYGNLIVFNNHSYSPSTSKHQRATKQVLGYDRSDMIYINTRKSLSSTSLSDIVVLLESQIEANNKLAGLPRKRQTTKDKLANENEDLLAKINRIRVVNTTVGKLILNKEGKAC